MNILLIGIAVVSAAGMYMSIQRFIKRKRLRAALAFILWSIFFGLALYPQSAHTLNEVFNLGENLNTLIFAGLAVLFFLNIQTMRMVDTLRSDMTKMVRADALKDLDEIANKDTIHKQ